jgi:outer membrane receptor protein involved in Fe transport
MSNGDNSRFSLLPLSFAIAVALGGQVVHAQDASGQDSGSNLEEVVVTGSRITRKDYVSPSPLVTTSIDSIVNSGRTTIDEYLRDQPQFAPGSGSYSNDSNGGTAGRATLNLRNLGAKRNLVIMDGRRLMSSGTDGAIDINTIPSLAIGGIETISGGASATYGSDALSGVVNFKTRTDLDGVEFVVQNTSLDRDGDDTTQYGIAYGAKYADGKGYVLLTADHIDRGGVAVLEREFFNINPQASSFTVYGRSRIGRDWVSVDNDGTVFLTDRGTGYGGDPSNVFGDPVELPLIVDDNGGIRTHGQYRNWLQVPLEQTNFFAKTDFELENGTTAYGHLMYGSSVASNVGAEPISAGVWGVTIPQDNYYLQQVPELAATVPAQGITTFQTRILQAGNRFYDTENDVYQLLGGLSGQFGERDLNWDIHASFGKTETTDRTISGAINVAALQELIDTTDTGTGITPLCEGGYNPFGGSTPLSAACLEYISRTPVNKTTLEQTVVEGIIEGKLADMPAGEARFAVTGHYRENTYEFDADRDIEAGELANLASSADTRGDIEVAEIAGEVLLPLVSDSAAFDSVNLTLGARLSEYEPAGSTETYKIEMDAKVNNNLMLRAGFQHAVRAPNVEEFFRASLLRVQAFNDVCSVSYRGPRVDAVAEAALCAEQGAGASYRQAGSSAPTITNGNPDLVPEEADTFTLGFVTNFSLGESDLEFSVDYYNIEVDKAIETLTAADVFVKCFNIDGTSNPAYDNNYIACQQINRPSPVDLDPVNQPILNLGGIKTSGIDLTTSLNIPVDALAWGEGKGSIGFRSLITYLDKHEIQAFTDEGFVDFAGTVSTTQALPELKMLNTLTVNTGPVTVTASWRHIASMDDRSVASNSESEIEGVGTFDYFDLSGRFAVNEHFELYGGITNLSDKTPPQVGGSVASGEFSQTNLGVYDGIGRTYFVGLKAGF